MRWSHWVVPHALGESNIYIYTLYYIYICILFQLAHASNSHLPTENLLLIQILFEAWLKLYKGRIVDILCDIIKEQQSLGVSIRNKKAIPWVWSFLLAYTTLFCKHQATVYKFQSWKVNINENPLFKIQYRRRIRFTWFRSSWPD